MDCCVCFIGIIVLYFLISKARQIFVRKFINLNGVCVFITGGSSGVGEAFAKYCSSKGAKVIIMARNIKELERVKSECANPNSVIPVQNDITDFERTIKTCKELSETHKVDILINCAGKSVRYACEEALDSVEVEKSLFDLNLLGQIAVTKGVLQQMINRRQGRIVGISSASGLLGVPLRTSYCASKYGLRGYLEALRTEVSQYNISISLVYPGYIRTNLSMNALQQDGTAYNQTDSRIAAGIDPDIFASKVFPKIWLNHYEIVQADLKTNAILFVQWLWPGLAYRIMGKYRSVSESVRDKKNS